MATTAILAGPGEFLPVLFVLIAIASGVINFVKERKAAAEREVGNGGDGNVQANADGEMQSEIDAFLQEVSPDDFEEAKPARQGNAQQQQRRRRKSSSSSDEEAERRRRVRARREHERQQAEEDSQRQSVRKRHLETSDLSEVSSRHKVANRHVGSTVEDRHLEDHIDGPSQAAAPLAATTVGNSSVAALLQSPDGIRDAILLNEILGPPLANRPGLKR
jgi:ABC-type Na+ efflux pump permease subunit